MANAVRDVGMEIWDGKLSHIKPTSDGSASCIVIPPTVTHPRKCDTNGTCLVRAYTANLCINDVNGF